MDSAESMIDIIVKLLGEIQKEEKIGTAFERYESHLLWDLGHNIREYARIKGEEGDVVGDIMNKLRERSIHCQPVILKNAETITMVWPSRANYIADTKDAPYGKLRDALTVLDPDFVNQHKVTNEDQKELIKHLCTSTFKAFRAYIKKIKAKYDPLGEAVDFDELFNDVFESNAQLREMVERNDALELKRFRSKLDAEYIENTRRLIATMKSEDVLKTLKTTISNMTPSVRTDKITIVDSLLNVTACLLLLLKSSESRRDALRQRIGSSELGRLSTLLKATTSESERQRYIRSRQMLEKLASGNTIIG